MLSDLRIEKLTRHGIALMQEERDLALKGDFTALAELNNRKEKFLEEIEELARMSQRVGSLELRETRRSELETLFEILRRRAQENQMLLRAAEAGVKSAARRVDALSEAEGPLGVYNVSGEPVRHAASGTKRSEVF